MAALIDLETRETVKLTNPNSGRLQALDGWRAISAIIVIASHVQQYSSVKVHIPFLDMEYGRLGVQFFFGISGFVIGRGFVRADQLNLRGFYVRRLFRIIPPLVLYVLTIEALALTGVLPAGSSHVARALTFTCNVSNADCGGWFGDHMWSLSVEEQFYLVVPFLFFYVRDRRVLTALTLALPIAPLGLYALGLRDLGSFAMGFLTIGYGVAAAIHEARLRAWIARIPVWTSLVAFAVIVLMWEMPLSKAEAIVHALCVPPLILFILLTTTFKESWISALLSSRLLTRLGVASYSLYLWQQLATYAYPGASVWFYLASVAACVALSFALYRWMEAPLIALGAKLSRSLQRTSHDLAPAPV